MAIGEGKKIFTRGERPSPRIPLRERWLWADVVAPLVVTRAALLFVGWFSQNIAASPDYPLKDVVGRGWNFSPYRLLDIWGRWDTGWYFDIVARGYYLQGGILTTQSNLSFFPLYPYLVRFVTWGIPASLLTPGAILFAGVIVSNVCLLGALILLHRLTTAYFDGGVARRTVLYLLLFPTGFFLSAFYTEATFLFLSLAAFYAASRKVWPVACLAGGLLALTRVPGFLVSVPLLWMYAESIQWRWRQVSSEILWFLLIPGGLLAFFVIAYPITGNLLGPVIIHGNWHHQLVIFPLLTILEANDPNGALAVLDQWTAVALLALIVPAWKWMPTRAYGIYLALSLLLPLGAGTLTSMVRYAVVMFPAFIVLALLGRNATFDRWLIVLFFALQVLLMALWSQFYWVA